MRCLAAQEEGNANHSLSMKEFCPSFPFSQSINCLKKSNYIQSEIKESLSLHCSAALANVTAADIEDDETIASRNLKLVF